VKIIVTACAALCLLASACNHEDTGAGGMWGRTVEPRLRTTRSWHACERLSRGRIVAGAQCAAPVQSSAACEPIESHEEANRMLVSQPQCTDAAVAALKGLSRTDAAAMSDLAGAYYVRAQRDDNPADLLNAFDAAEKAVDVKPRPQGAQFNYALILEALSLNADAIDAWQRAAAVEEGSWAEEARAHRAALMAKKKEWPEVRAQIDAALDAHDVARTRALIAEFPASAQKHFEEEVLPHSASSQIATFAEALSQFFKDRYFTDVAAASGRAREGHLRFAEARVAEANLGANAAVRLYKEAEESLRRARSPQYLLARIAHAGQSGVATNDYASSAKELDAVAEEGRSYPSVVARVELGRIYAYQYLDRYNDLFAAHEAALKAYSGLGDREDAAAAEVRAISAMSVLDLKNEAWRRSFVAMRDAARIVNPRTLQLLFGVPAKAAFALGHPEVALRYQTMAVNVASPRQRLIALRERAAIELRLQRYDDAQRDIEAAIRESPKDERVRLALEARLAEVEGERDLRFEPERAVEKFTRAINLAEKDYASFRVNLYAERADAYRRLNRFRDAENDMEEALGQLHDEEEKLLQDRTHARDDLWPAYFSRFQETYDLLIRQLIGEGQIEKAFLHAERSRAYEPLDLVRKLPTAPPAFRALAAQPDVAKLRSFLPPDTFLIEYRVFDDQTYAWIVGRDVFAGRWLKATRNDAQRWTTALQNAANNVDFDRNIDAPYDALLKAPLDVIHRSSANIVVIPDRELRGLPFNALRNPDTRRYLIEDHVPSISGSALLYVFALLRDRDMVARDTSALLVGNPSFDPSWPLAKGLKPLPFARREVEEVRAFYRSDVLTGNDATPEQFLRLAKDHAIVHVAAHGVVNADAPSQSYLLFHGVLNAEMLMNEFHTDKTRLVILGACSSAGGLPVGAEGIAPLVRPIVGAGVPGVIGALWDIDDATAFHLLVSFHDNYRRGSNAAKALRDAQLNMLRSGKAGQSPARFWAPFQAIGYASSPFAPVENTTKEKPP
jgi:CHAT domain-containing protein